MNTSPIRECGPMEISEQDVLVAMKTMQGYIDITPADFREIYRMAYALAKNRLMNNLKAADVMSSPVHVIPAEMDLVDTAILLAEQNISGAPVIDGDGRIVGVISEKDFLIRMGAGENGSFMQVVASCLKNRGCLATPLRNQIARDIMTTPAIVRPPDVAIGAIATLFMEKKINRLPITDSDGHPIGIVTRLNLINSWCALG
ncbi:MAG: CBS domain-containing protein [Desulfatirhabdiaceae bacterium]